MHENRELTGNRSDFRCQLSAISKFSIFGAAAPKPALAGEDLSRFKLQWPYGITDFPGKRLACGVRAA